jgi:hypothetical protein
MLLIKLPTQLILYANAKQLKVYINTKQIAY